MQKSDSGLFALIDKWDPPETALIVHADTKWYGRIMQSRVGFFERLGQVVQSRGSELYLTQSFSSESDRLLEGPQKHIVIGSDRLPGDRRLFAQPAYVSGFWYLDPKGYFWNSSIMGKVFNPDDIDATAARRFFDGVSGWNIRNNVSGRKQPPATQLQKAEVAVFTQDIENYIDPVHFLTTKQMVRASARAAAGGTGLCYVKPHPLYSPAQRAWLARLCDRLPNVRLVDCSIHDIIRASEIVVSQNSAVGFEALMHRKAVVTCAKTDYAPATLCSKTTAELRANIRNARDHFARFPFEKFLYWFLQQNMLEPQSELFPERVLSRIFGDGKELSARL